MEEEEDKMREEIGKDERRRKILEEYETWKENTRSWYDMVITHGLECPSFTVEWLPDRDEPPGKDYSAQNMILGTHTSENEPNYLMIAQVQLPLEHAEFDILDAIIIYLVEIIQYINHDGEVNRARYMPQNPLIIATKAVSAEVNVFDYRKHTSEPTPDAQICLWDINAIPNNKTLQAMSHSGFICLMLLNLA